MRKVLRITFLLSAITFCLTPSTSAQSSGATNVYRTQFFEMRAKVKSIFDRAEQQGRGEPNYKAKTNLQEEILALTTLIHRLEEEALRSGVEAMKRGRDSDKTLLLVSQGCKAMDFVLSALDSYITTDDKAFLGLAREGDGLIKSVERML